MKTLLLDPRDLGLEVGHRVGGDDDQDLDAALAVANEPPAGMPFRVSSGRVPEQLRPRDEPAPEGGIGKRVGVLP